MKRIIGISLLIGNFLFFSGMEASIAQPKSGGILKIAIPSAVSGNPVTQAAGLGDILPCRVLFSSLVRYSDKDLSPLPDLAESWSTPEARVWTFKLRKDVKWHDGKPFTADDVDFTIKSMLDPKVRARQAGMLKGLEKFEVLDKYTVRFTLDSPNAALPINLGYLFFMIPKHLLEGKDINSPADFLKRPIGTGPFRFKDQVIGESFTVEANPDYFLGKPYLDAIVFKTLPDLNTQIAQLKSGELDLTVIQPLNIDALKGAPHINIDAAKQVNYFYIGLNNKNPLLADPKVRQALTYGLDRKAIINTVLKGHGMVATGPISPILNWAYTDKVKQYPYDLKKAVELLTESGWKKGSDGILEKEGKKFRITAITAKGVLDGIQLATIAQQYYKQLGVDFKIEIVEFGDLWKKPFAGDFEATVEYLVTAPTPDVTSSYACNASFNRWQFCDKESEALLIKARGTTDRTAQATYYQEFQKRIAELQPMVYLYYPEEILAINKRVQNLPMIGYRHAMMYAEKIWIK